MAQCAARAVAVAAGACAAPLLRGARSCGLGFKGDQTRLGCRAPQGARCRRDVATPRPRFSFARDPALGCVGPARSPRAWMGTHPIRVHARANSATCLRPGASRPDAVLLLPGASHIDRARRLPRASSSSAATPREPHVRDVTVGCPWRDARARTRPQRGSRRTIHCHYGADERYAISTVPGSIRGARVRAGRSRSHRPGIGLCPARRARQGSVGDQRSGNASSRGGVQEPLSAR